MRIGVTRDHKAGKQQALTLQDRKTNELVKKIRQDVGNWRADGYRGVTATTLRLLHHWTDPPAMKLRPFFAQVEAIETLIWLREVATRQTTARRELQEAARHHNDGIVRLCSKMATGTGKTTVMGMAIAWQTLNAARSTRTRNVMHTDRFVVFAPGHTVRERLGVLHPSASDNVYDEMGLVPHDLRELLNRAKVKVVNFQAFTQRELIEDSSARKLLGKGNREDIESWEAAVRRVLAGVLDGDRTPVNLVIECKGRGTTRQTKLGSGRRSTGSPAWREPLNCPTPCGAGATGSSTIPARCDTSLVRRSPPPRKADRHRGRQEVQAPTEFVPLRPSLPCQPAHCRDGRADARRATQTPGVHIGTTRRHRGRGRSLHRPEPGTPTPAGLGATGADVCR